MLAAECPLYNMRLDSLSKEDVSLSSNDHLMDWTAYYTFHWDSKHITTCVLVNYCTVNICCFQ